MTQSVNRPSRRRLGCIQPTRQTRRTVGGPRPLALPVDPAETAPTLALRHAMLARLQAAPSPSRQGRAVSAAAAARAKRHTDWLATLEREWYEALAPLQYRTLTLRWAQPAPSGEAWVTYEVVGLLTGFGLDAEGRRSACLMTAPTALRRGERPERHTVPLMWVIQVQP